MGCRVREAGRGGGSGNGRLGMVGLYPGMK